VQQALKDKGHDPGSIDGIMGQRTKEALRSFQQKEGLQATGTLDTQTAEKLGVSMDARSGKGSGELKAGRNEIDRGPKTGEARTDRQKNVE
jgi:peptidoglycan hydrolase-like protein with peptidoglycan-binding domain